MRKKERGGRKQGNTERKGRGKEKKMVEKKRKRRNRVK